MAVTPADIDLLIEIGDQIEAETGKIQSSKPGTSELTPSAIRAISQRYVGWYHRCLRVLAIDSQEEFRAEYEGESRKPRIRAFLENPLATNPLFMLGWTENSRPSSLYWLRPWETIFQRPLNRQRMILIEAKSLQAIAAVDPVSIMSGEDHALTGLESISAETRFATPKGDSRKVFVVHGRNLKAKDAMFDFLRSLDLSPVEWEEAVTWTRESAPYIGRVLEEAFSRVCAVVVILSGDDEARLRSQFRSPDDTDRLSPQPRMNVVFEAGMALGLKPDQTLLVQIGATSGFSDIAGRHMVRVGADENQARNALRTRLNTCGCHIGRSGDDWMVKGDFAAALEEARCQRQNSVSDDNGNYYQQGERLADPRVDPKSLISSDSESEWNGIVPSFRMSSTDGEISSTESIIFVIGNYGDKPAIDVRLEFEDPLVSATRVELSATPQFKKTYRLLKPHQEIDIPIDTESSLSLAWIHGIVRSTYRVNVIARDSATGKLVTSHHVLDLGSAFPLG